MKTEDDRKISALDIVLVIVATVGISWALVTLVPDEPPIIITTVER